MSFTDREGLIDNPSLDIRRTQSEPNDPELHRREPIFLPSGRALLPSDTSMLTQPSTSINCQLDIKLENSASEEIHLESSSFPISDWEATTCDRIFDDDDDLHPLVANYFSRLGEKDLPQERYSDLMEEQTMLLEEQKTRAGVDLVLSYEDQEWLKNFPVSKQNLLEELALRWMPWNRSVSFLV
jgi:hypothetical protein